MGALIPSQLTAEDADARRWSEEEEKIFSVAARRGDRRAFTQLVRWHQQAVYGYLHARLLKSADAEDLCQEVFLRFYQERSKLDRAVAVRAWLIGIARNALREHVRHVTKRREIVWTELCLELESLAESQPSAEVEILEHLPVCIESLGQSARQSLDLKYRSHLKLAEIGQKLHRSEGAVKLLMYRARQALKRCLDHRLKES